MLKKVAIIHLFFLVIAAGIAYYNFSGPNLTWNMLLALVSLDFMVVAYYIRPKWLKLIPVLLWFFFYPNTFYMVTDIIHMHFAGTVLYERSSMILFMLYVPSILFGVMVGLESVSIFSRLYSMKSLPLRTGFYVLLSLISSFAIHIGRYARLNSWDIFTRPLIVIQEILAVISWDAFIFVIGFTCIQVMCLIFVDKEFSA